MKESDTWCTPKWLADVLGEFDLDPCSNPNSHIRAATNLSVETGDDGLEHDWRGCKEVFVNPPYSDVGPWAAKATDAAYYGVRVTLLLKLDPTTRWWSTLMGGRDARVFPFRRRIQFERPGKKPASPPWPATLVCLNAPIHSALWPYVWRF